MSHFFSDEPAVLAMNLMGIDADTLGNHNFDHGLPYLQALVDIADFPYLAANLENLEGNLVGVPEYRVFDVGGVMVGVVGIVNPDAPSLFPADLGTIVVTDPVPAANRARAGALAGGAKVTIALTHLRVIGTDHTGAPFGPLIDFASEVGGFDVIFGDHMSTEFSMLFDNKLVVAQRGQGRTYARVSLDVDPVSGRLVDRRVEFITPMASGVAPDPAIVALLAPFRAALRAVFDVPIGVATALFPRGGNIERLREVAIGNLVTDAMRIRYGTQLALLNGGSIRAPLPSPYLPADLTLRRTTPGYAPGPPFDLVRADPYVVLPFGDFVITRTVTGAQLYAMLEHGVSAIPAANGRFPQISGFRFVYDSSHPAGARVVSVELSGGTPILPDGTGYTIAIGEFISEGGDGYAMLADGRGDHREVMADVLVLHIQNLGTITPVIEGRITRLP